MAVKVSGYYGAGNGKTTALTYRIGDRPPVNDAWVGIGNGVLLSRGDGVGGILDTLADSDMIGVRISDPDGQAHDLLVSARGAKAKIPEFRRDCAAAATG